MDNSFLNNRRKELGLPQKYVANQLGYSPQMISLWESGKSYPHISTWSKYASILDIDLEGFILQKKQKQNSLCNTDKFDPNKFAKNLKKLRNKNGITQKDLGNRLSVNSKVVSLWENGDSFPSLEEFIKLSKIFNLTFDELYFVNEIPIAKSDKNKKIFSIMFSMSVVLNLILSSLVIANVFNSKKSHPSSQNGIKYYHDDDNHWIKDEFGNIVYKENHSFNDGEIIEEDEISIVQYQCQICGYIKAVVIPNYVLNNEILYFGSYPQSKINDEGLINNLNDLNNPDERNYYFYNGDYYAKRVAKLSIYGAPYCSGFNDGTSILEDETYWFKVEPIAWKVLEKTDDYYLLFSNIIIDSGPFFYEDNHSNNYKDSYVRHYLNNDFINRAFYEDLSSLMTVEVDNSLQSTTCDINDYICENTFDKCYLPSHAELLKAEYGLGGDFYSGDIIENLISRYSDYSRMNKMRMDNLEYGNYYTRSPGKESEYHVECVNIWGHFSAEPIPEDWFLGYRPIIKINR